MGKERKGKGDKRGGRVQSRRTVVVVQCVQCGIWTTGVALDESVWCGMDELKATQRFIMWTALKYNGVVWCPSENKERRKGEKERRREGKRDRAREERGGKSK